MRGKESWPTKTSSSLRGQAGNGLKFYTFPQKRKPRGLQTNSCSKLRLQTSLGTEKNASFCAKWTFCCQESATYWISPGGESPGRGKKLRKHNAGKSTFFHIFKLKQQKTTLIVLPATTTLQLFSLHSIIRQTFEVDKSWGGG